MGDAGVKETPRRATTFFIMIILCPVTACAASLHRVSCECHYLDAHNLIMMFQDS